MFINLKNANRTTPIGGRWLTLATGIPIHVLREDRILHEARVTGGDVRRICDLFGLSVEGALRYLPDPEPRRHAAAPVRELTTPTAVLRTLTTSVPTDRPFSNHEPTGGLGRPLEWCRGDFVNMADADVQDGRRVAGYIGGDRSRSPSNRTDTSRRPPDRAMSFASSSASPMVP